MTNTTLTSGWVSQPNGRGTIDILQNCMLTMMLCSWSVLVLNILDERQGNLKITTNKLRWMVFTIFFPEMVTGIAAEQWRSARQSVEDISGLQRIWETRLRGLPDSEHRTSLTRSLSNLRSFPWTLRHAFLADMGGIHLECPDFVTFPVDSKQMLYLIQKGHVDYPRLETKTIWDKNKADGFARAITLMQVTWFLLQCLGRCFQHLPLSTMELSTLGFIFCTIATLFFWFHKPLDVSMPIILKTDTKLAEMISKAEAVGLGPYTRTPLDFVKGEHCDSSLTAPFWFGFRVVFDWRTRRVTRPVKVIGNSEASPPRGLKAADVVFGIVFTVAYFGIYLAGWNFYFPTTSERLLWRTSSILLLGLSTTYFVAVGLGSVFAARAARVLFPGTRVLSPMQAAQLLPRWSAILLHGPILLFYIVARAYLLIEGPISMRKMPTRTYATVNWSNVLPHF